MGNPRMRTKPFQLTPAYMKSHIQGALDDLVKEHGRGIRYREQWTYRMAPTIQWPYETVITFKGHALYPAEAIYKGPYGEWEIRLKCGGYQSRPIATTASREEIMSDECTLVSGKAQCTKESDLWRENAEQRRARARELAAQGIV